MRLYRLHIFGSCTTLSEQLLARKIGKKFLREFKKYEEMNEEEDKKNKKMQK